MNKTKTMVTAIAIAGIISFSLIQMSLAALKPVVSVTPPHLEVSPEETFTVNITIDPKGNEIFGVDYILRFDNTLLNATSLTQGAFFSGFNTMPMGEGINNTLGRIDYGEAIMGSVGVTNPGTLTTITFQAIAELGISELGFEDVMLSDPNGYEFSNVIVNNGTCDIEAAEQTPTPTPAPTSGGGDGGDGGASVTPTQTLTPSSTPTPSPSSTPAQTPGLTPMQTLTTTPAPAITTSPSSTPAASTPLSEGKENKRLPGFEAGFAILTLLAISYLILKGRRRLK